MNTWSTRIAQELVNAVDNLPEDSTARVCVLEQFLQAKFSGAVACVSALESVTQSYQSRMARHLSRARRHQQAGGLNEARNDMRRRNHCAREYAVLKEHLLDTGLFHTPRRCAHRVPLKSHLLDRADLQPIVIEWLAQNDIRLVDMMPMNCVSITRMCRLVVRKRQAWLEFNSRGDASLFAVSWF